MPVFQINTPNPARGGQPGFVDPMNAIKDQEKIERLENIENIVTSFAKKDAQERKQQEARLEGVAEANLKREYRNLERFGDSSMYSDYVKSEAWIPEGLSADTAGFLKKSYLDMQGSGLSFFDAEKNRQAQTQILGNTEKLVTKIVSTELQGISQIESVMTSEQISNFLQGEEAGIRPIIDEALENAPIQLANLTESQLQSIIDKTYVDFKQEKVNKKRAQRDRAVDAKLSVWLGNNSTILDYRNKDSIDEFHKKALTKDMSLNPKFAMEVLGNNYSTEQFEALERVVQQEYTSAQKRNIEQEQASASSEEDARVLDLYMRGQSDFDALRFVPVGSSEFGPKYDEFISTSQGRIAELEKVEQEDNPERSAQARRSIRSLQDLIKVAKKSRDSKVLAYKESDTRLGILRLAQMNLEEALRARIATGDIPNTPEDVDNMVAEEIVKLGRIELESGKFFDFSSDFAAEGFPPGEGFKGGDAEIIRGEAVTFVDAVASKVVADVRSHQAIKDANSTVKDVFQDSNNVLNEMLAENGGIHALFANQFQLKSGESWYDSELLTKEARNQVIKRFKIETKKFITKQLKDQRITFDNLDNVLDNVFRSHSELYEGTTRIRFTESEMNRIKNQITSPNEQTATVDRLNKEIGSVTLGVEGIKQLEQISDNIYSIKNDTLTPTKGQYHDSLSGLLNKTKKNIKLLTEFTANPLASFDSSNDGVLAQQFKRSYFQGFEVQFFADTDENETRRNMIMGRLLNPSEKRGYVNYVSRFMRQVKRHGEEGERDSHKIAQRFVSHFLANTTNNAVKSQLQSLWPLDPKTITQENRNDALRGLVLNLSHSLPEGSDVRTEIQELTNVEFGGKSKASLQDLLVRGMIASAEIDGSFANKDLYVKAKSTQLNISDDELALVLSNPLESGSDEVLIRLFRNVMGGYPPAMTSGNANFSAYVKGWKQEQKSLIDSVRNRNTQGLNYVENWLATKPVHVQVLQQRFTADRRPITDYKVFYDDDSVEIINNISEHFGNDVQVKSPPVAPDGTGTELLTTPQPTETEENQVEELNETEEAKPKQSQSLVIPDLPEFTLGQEMKSVEEINALVNAIYGVESSTDDAFQRNVHPDVFLVFHPDAFPTGDFEDLTYEKVSSFFGSEDMSMVNFVSADREVSKYYSTSHFQTFGGQGRGEGTNVLSDSGEYEKEDLRNSPMLSGIWTDQMETVRGINASIEEANESILSGTAMGAVSGAAGGFKLGLSAGFLGGGPVASAVSATGGVLIGGIVGGLAGMGMTANMGADEEEQKAYIEAYNPKSATPVEVRFMIHALARIQTVRQEGTPDKYGHTFKDLSRYERKLISDLAQINPSNEAFLGDLD